MDEQATTKTELERTADARKIIAKATSLNDVLGEISRPASVAVDKLPPVPKHLKMTDEVRLAMSELGMRFGVVQPSTHRQLTRKEVEEITKEREVIDDIVDLLNKRREAISETMRTHMDLKAREAGLVDDTTPRDKWGHYIAELSEEAEGLDGNGVWVKTPSRGTPYVDAERMEALAADGVLPREDYLAMTRATRVFDQTKAMEYLRKNPIQGLKFMRLITARKMGSVSITYKKAT